MSDRAILHIDMNNFYASVECMMNPDLKPHPIAVCGSQEDRHGIVLAKNYKAKAFGVSTGEAIWQAKQKCPNLVIVPPHYEQYMRFSKLAREIYGRYTDLIEPFGMDEVWADVTGCQRYIGTPLHFSCTDYALTMHQAICGMVEAKGSGKMNKKTSQNLTIWLVFCAFHTKLWSE